jgi:GrpB protein
MIRQLRATTDVASARPVVRKGLIGPEPLTGRAQARAAVTGLAAKPIVDIQITLRRSADDREAYADLKMRLQQQDWDTMNHYADAKSALIAEMTVRAEQWALSTGWSP